MTTPDTDYVHIGRPPTAPAPAPRKRRRKWPLAVAAAVLLAAGGTVAYLALRPGPMTITGQIVVVDNSRTGSGLAYGANTGECVGTNGYDDLHQGTQIVVSDASGTTIADTKAVCCPSESCRSGRNDRRQLISKDRDMPCRRSYLARRAQALKHDLELLILRPASPPAGLYNFITSSRST